MQTQHTFNGLPPELIFQVKEKAKNEGLDFAGIATRLFKRYVEGKKNEQQQEKVWLSPAAEKRYIKEVEEFLKEEKIKPHPVAHSAEELVKQQDAEIYAENN